MSTVAQRREELELLSLGYASLGADVVVTTRAGGVSSAPYDTLNLADYVGDDRSAVRENRRRLAEAMGVEVEGFVTARQVHGTGVASVRMGVDPGEADILATDDPSIALCILVADCAPIVVLDPGARALVVAHAGWRGTASGVAAAAVRAAIALGADPSRCHAAIGPCISQRGYQVGPEVAEALAAAGCADAVVPDGTGRYLADLAAANVTQLVEAGVPPGLISMSQVTTDGGTTLFSDRAARPCGRFALAARLLEGGS